MTRPPSAPSAPSAPSVPSAPAAPPVPSASPEPSAAAERLRPFRLSGARLSAGLLGGLAAAAGIALTATSGWLIVRASEQPPILTLMTAIVGVRAFGMARVVFRYAERLRSHDAALAELADARVRTYERLVPLTPARLGRRGRADVLTGVVDDLTDVTEAAVRVTVPVIATAVAAVLALALTTWALPAAGAVVTGMLAAAALLVLVATRLETAGQRELLDARAATATVAALVADHAGELRAIGAQRDALGWVADAHRRLRGVVRRQARGRALVSGGLLLVTGLATAAVAVAVAGVALHPGLKALLVLTPVALGDAMGVLTDATRAAARARACADRVDALLDQDPAVADHPPVDTAVADHPPVDTAAADRDLAPDDLAGHGDLPSQGVLARGGDPARRGGLARDGVTATTAAVPHIELRGLRAGWTADAVHLGPLDLDVPPGSRLAVTGPNGAGKSTLLAVLARHLDPVSGVLRFDGRDVRTQRLDEVRGRVALVDDEPHIFATTLRENLRLALPASDRGRADDTAAAVDRDLGADRRLVAALRRAGLGDWFDGLPSGLDTRVGAGGRGVSGGERARLAVARALLSQRPVILLDEPVAHLDEATARAVLADVDAAAGERTVVMVTHHAVGLEHFDRTLELAAPAGSVG